MSGKDESSWLADGVKEIERITKTANIVKPELFELKYEPDGHYGIVLPGPSGMPNTVNRHVAAPDWHKERLETPGELVSFIAGLEQRGGYEAADGVAYVGRESIVFHYDFADRRSRATVPLVSSAPWTWLNAKCDPMPQPAFVRLLRITFAGCLNPNDAWMLDFFRNVQMSTEGDYAGRVQKGSEALGKKIERVLRDNEKMPDEVTLSVPVYENYDLSVPIRCAIELHMGTGEPRFELLAFPNQLTRALNYTLTAIQSLVGSSGAPTYLGSAFLKQ